VWSAGARPNPPSNVSVWETHRPHAVHISWHPSTYSPVSVAGYIIEYTFYRTEWETLAELADDENEYTWTSASVFVEYRFRVRGISSTGVRSEPTQAVNFYTTGTPTYRFSSVDRL